MEGVSEGYNIDEVDIRQILKSTKWKEKKRYDAWWNRWDGDIWREMLLHWLDSLKVNRRML